MPKDRQHFNANGKAKVKHKSRADALKHVMSLHNRRGSLPWIYRCTVCQRFHVGGSQG